MGFRFGWSALPGSCTAGLVRNPEGNSRQSELHFQGGHSVGMHGQGSVERLGWSFLQRAEVDCRGVAAREGEAGLLGLRRQRAEADNHFIVVVGCLDNGDIQA